MIFMLNCWGTGWGGLMMLGQMAFSSSCAELSGTRSLRGQACQNHSVHSLPNKVWTVSLFRLINLRFFFCQRLSNTLQLDDLNIPTCIEAQWERWHLWQRTFQMCGHMSDLVSLTAIADSVFLIKCNLVGSGGFFSKMYA